MPTIPELLQTPEEKRDLGWLQMMLRHAVKLEFATLPPYLCGLWSVKAPAAPESEEAYQLLLSVILQEMLHMGLACNMLTTIGGYPIINRDIPTYPGPLPGGVEPSLVVYLAGLSRDLLSEVFMPIEKPAWKPVGLAALAETYVSIGQFYQAIADGFQAIKPTFTGERQMEMPIDGGTVVPIKSLDDALAAITEITEQGEGTPQSPEQMNITDPSDLAHYYKFAEIFNGRHLVQGPDGQWGYTGAPIPFPDVYPMAKVPPGGYPDLVEEIRFRQQFTTVLDNLQGAWETGDANRLDDAIAFMFTLAPLAQAMMQIPLPDGSGTYGPDFQLAPRVGESNES